MKILIKKESKTNPNYGCFPEEKNAKELLKAGIINLDKPVGITSTEADEHVKRVLDIKKAGHGGTLDPNASGVLPIAINNGTKILRALLKAKKEYVCVMHLHENVNNKRLKKALDHFTGTITQKPPVRSAVRRVKRKREVYDLILVERENKDCILQVKCGAGLYVRKLCHQIGEYLKSGAHMTELRRTAVGPFKEKDSVKLEELKEVYKLWKSSREEKLKEQINPIEKGVQHLPKIWVLDTAVDSICHGARLAVPGISKLNDDIRKGDLIALMTLKGELIALGRAKLSSGEIKSRAKGIAAELERVIMKRGIYPRF